MASKDFVRTSRTTCSVDGRASRAVGLAILGGRACRGNESTFADRRQLPDELGLVDVALALSQDRPGATEQVGRLLDDVGALDAWERATLGAAWIGKTRPTAARARQVLAGATFSDSGSSEITTPWSLVAENGALWFGAEEVPHRAVYLLAQHLIAVVPAEEIVPDLHAAYERIGSAEESVAAQSWRGFIAGPSKTADIEQALVIGAHGPRSLLICLV